jgi:hypothetical protein
MATRYFTEMGFCFEPRGTAYTLESNTCLARDAATESLVLSAWTDGSWWAEADGVTLTGWIEQDGVTFYPPLESYPA